MICTIKKNKFFLAGLLAVFLTWGVFFLYIWPKMFYWKNGEIVAGGINVWGDWPAHLSIASGFAYRSISSWLINPLYHSAQLSYPFVADAVSGLLMRFGVDVVYAFVIPSIITTILLLFLLYAFYHHLTKSPCQSFFAVSLFFVNGGLGFLWFFRDLLLAPKISTILFPPLEYTSMDIYGIRWVNIVISELLPQRTFLLGIPIILALLLVLLHFDRKRFEVSTAKIVLFGVLSSLILFVHVHSYLVFIIFCTVFFVFNRQYWKKGFVLALSAAVPSVVIYLLFHSGQLSSFVQWYPGWLSNARAKNMNFFYFVLLNWGLFLPFSLFAVWKTRLYKNFLVVGGLLIFVIANLFIFQPWDWDNTKLFTWSYLVLVFPVVAYLSCLWRSKYVMMKLLVVLIFVVLSLSGFIDLWRVLHTERNAHSLFSDSDVDMAKRFRNVSEPTAFVLNAPRHNHWVQTLAGRPVVMGFLGTLWSWGITAGSTEADVKKMFLGNESLLEKYNVSYVVIGQSELSDYTANESFFCSKFKKILENKDYRVYKIS